MKFVKGILCYNIFENFLTDQSSQKQLLKLLQASANLSSEALDLILVISPEISLNQNNLFRILMLAYSVVFSFTEIQQIGINYTVYLSPYINLNRYKIQLRNSYQKEEIGLFDLTNDFLGLAGEMKLYKPEIENIKFMEVDLPIIDIEGPDLKRFEMSCMGGTFDYLHIGHKVKFLAFYIDLSNFK